MDVRGSGAHEYALLPRQTDAWTVAVDGVTDRRWTDQAATLRSFASALFFETFQIFEST